MLANPTSQIEMILKEYLEQRQNFLSYTKKRNDTEKEYNKLITCYNGEANTYSLVQADKIYRTYLDVIDFEEQSKNAERKFHEAEEKLKEIGRILFEATIHAEVAVPVNGGAYDVKKLTVRFLNGQVQID